MTLDDYVSALRASLCKRWAGAVLQGQVLPLCGMTNSTYIDSQMIRGRVSKRDLVPPDPMGFSLQVDGGPLECWVSPTLNRYRYTIVFTSFLRVNYGIDYVAENAGKEKENKYQIDHAHSCESVRVNRDADFILLTPVKQSINGGWATIEKYMANDGFRPVATQLANYFTIAKLAGISPPSVSASANVSEESQNLYDAMFIQQLLDVRERTLDLESIAELIIHAQRGAKNFRVKHRKNRE